MKMIDHSDSKYFRATEDSSVFYRLEDGQGFGECTPNS